MLVMWSNLSLITLVTLQRMNQRLDWKQQVGGMQDKKSLKAEAGLIGTHSREIRGARIW